MEHYLPFSWSKENRREICKEPPCTWSEVITNTGVIIAISQLGQKKKFIALHVAVLWTASLNKEHFGVLCLSPISHTMCSAYTLKSGWVSLTLFIHSAVQIQLCTTSPNNTLPNLSTGVNGDHLTDPKLCSARIFVPQHPISRKIQLNKATQGSLLDPFCFSSHPSNSILTKEVTGM